MPVLWSLWSQTCSSLSLQFPGTTQTSLTRAQRHPRSPSFSNNLAPVRFIRFWLRYSYSFRSRQCVFYEHRHSQLCDFRWKSRAFCRHTRALWTSTSLSSTVPVRVDDARRRTAARAAHDEQLQRVVLRQLIHRQRSAMGVVTESRWRV